MKVKREAEALPYYEKLVEEFEQSEYLRRGAEADRRAQGAGGTPTAPSRSARRD